MAQSGFTPVSLYYSTTAAATPTAGNLQLGELSINITDGKLYYRTVGGVVTLLASATTAAGTATNIAGGTAGAIVYQSGVGATTFLSVGTSGYIVTSNGTVPVYTNPTSITVGNATAAVTSTNIAGGVANQLVYQTAAGATGFAAAPITGYVLSWTGSAFSWVAGTPSSSAANLSGGAAGQVVYQSATGATAYVAVGTSGQVLLANGTGSPTWTNQSALSVGSATNATNATNAVTATNLASGVAGALPYQTSSGATSFSGAGTSGQVLLSGGTGSPTWVNQSSLSAGSTALATNVAGGTASQILYQSGVGATGFIPNGTTGQALTSNGTSAPSWSTLGIAGGGTNSTATPTAGSIIYGTGTAYAPTSAGTSGQALVSNGSSAPAFATLGAFGGGTGLTSVGTSGNVLTSNGTGWTSAALAPSAMTLISTQTANNTSSTISWAGLTGYSNYLLIVNNIVGSTALPSYNQFYLQFGTGSTPTYNTSTYSYTYFVQSYASTTVTSGANNSSATGSSIPIAGSSALQSFGIDKCSAIVNITGINSTITEVLFNSLAPSPNVSNQYGTGFLAAGATVTAIKFGGSVGNLFSGSVSLYGISS